MLKTIPTPMLKKVNGLRSFLEHIGYFVLDQWHIVGQFHKKTDMNTHGRLGNILGRPNKQDLLAVENRTKGVIGALASLASKD